DAHRGRLHIGADVTEDAPGVRKPRRAGAERVAVAMITSAGASLRRRGRRPAHRPTASWGESRLVGCAGPPDGPRGGVPRRPSLTCPSCRPRTVASARGAQARTRQNCGAHEASVARGAINRNEDSAGTFTPARRRWGRGEDVEVGDDRPDAYRALPCSCKVPR